MNRLADKFRVQRCIIAEQCRTGGLKREPHQVGVYIADLPAGLIASPIIAHAKRRRDHRLRVRRQTGGLERRRGKLALSPPEGSFGGDQSVTQDRLVYSQAKVLDEIPRLRDQHLLDQIGVAEEQQAPMQNAKPNHVSIGLGAVGEEPKPVGAERLQMADKKAALRAGGRHSESMGAGAPRKGSATGS